MRIGRPLWTGAERVKYASNASPGAGAMSAEEFVQRTETEVANFGVSHLGGGRTSHTGVSMLRVNP